MAGNAPRLPPLKVVLTAGGTREWIDDVRYISNVATGSLPAAMADVLLRRGAEVHYIHGPGARLPGRLNLDLEPNANAVDIEETVERVRAELHKLQRSSSAGALHLYAITTAAEAAQRVTDVVSKQHPDLVACAMAVADFTPRRHSGKLPSQREGEAATLDLELLPTEKVIDRVRSACPDTALLGFKLLSHASLANFSGAARTLAERSGARWVFGNDMADYQKGLRKGWLFDARGEVIEALAGGHGRQGQCDLAEALIGVVVGELEQVD